MLRPQNLSRSRSIWAVLVLAGGALAGLSVAGLGEAQGQAASSSLGFAGPPSFADVVEQVNPAVVTISVTKDPVVLTSGFSFRPRSGSSLDEFLAPFFGIPGQRGQAPGSEPGPGQGSGFIIDADGYVATNYHVVEGARAVTVTLNSGESLAATVVGTDPRSDLALLKLESSEDLPVLHFGDSDRARVGEWVLAIGNPYGLGGSVTAGIISARGRDILSGPYDDFLQIDAPINSGNSGGPVFNSAGEVIGINTAIFSPNGGSVGIGFAIPSNQARRVLDALRDGGVVSRGALGVGILDVSEQLAAAVNLGRPRGALINDVYADWPAAEAGLLPGDIVTAFDGQVVDSPRALSRLVGASAAGQQVEIEVWRDGRRETFAAVLGNLDEFDNRQARTATRLQQYRRR